MQPEKQLPITVNESIPTAARMYDYYLGGMDILEPGLVEVSTLAARR